MAAVHANKRVRDEQLVSKFRLEIFVPGLGLLVEQYPLCG